MQHRVVWQWLDQNSEEASIHLGGVFCNTSRAISVLIICCMDILIKLSLLASSYHVVLLCWQLYYQLLSLECCCCLMHLLHAATPIYSLMLLPMQLLRRGCHYTASNDILHVSWGDIPIPHLPNEMFNKTEVWPGGS